MSRLVIVPAGGVAKVGQGYATYATHGDFLHELADCVGGVTLYASVFGPEHPEYAYFSQRLLDPARCVVVPLPGHSREAGGWQLLASYATHLATFLREVAGWRAAIVYSPSVTASLAALAIRLRAPRCRVVTSVWGDWSVLSRHLVQVGLTRRVLNLFQARFILRQERWLVARSVGTMVDGAVLRERYERIGRRVVETIPMMNLVELSGAAVEQPRDPVRVLYVGRLAPGKGLEVLIASLAALRQTRPALTLRVVGGGDRAYVASLEAEVRARRLEDAVSFAGVVPNGPALWEEYRGAAVFVLPSLSEGFPRVVYEAMATATPMVATDVGSVARVIRAGIDGLIVPPDNEPRLRAALESLLDDPDRAAALGRCARAAFDARFPPGRISSSAQQVVALLDGDS